MSQDGNRWEQTSVELSANAEVAFGSGKGHRGVERAGKGRAARTARAPRLLSKAPLACRGTNLAIGQFLHLEALADRRAGHTGPSWNNMVDLDTRRTLSSTSHLPPAPRGAEYAQDVWVSLGVAVVLGLLAVTIGLWPAERHAQAATPSESEMPSLSTKDPFPGRSAAPAGASEAQNTPTRFRNPFDASEVFEFPPGTSEEAARDSVAEILLQRARERGAQVSGMKHVHARPAPPLRIPQLASKSLFKDASWAARR
jgi:hypothetical protein